MRLSIFSLILLAACETGTQKTLQPGPDGGTTTGDASSSLCTLHPECCPSGAPARVGQACTLPGVPNIAAPECTWQGTCEATKPRECDVASLCCDGYFISDWDGMCNCAPPYGDDGNGGTTCSPAPQDNPTSSLGNGLGSCVQGRCVFP